MLYLAWRILYAHHFIICLLIKIVYCMVLQIFFSHKKFNGYDGHKITILSM